MKRRLDPLKRPLKRGHRMYFIIMILYVIVLCEIIVVNKLSNDLTVLWKKFEVIRSQNRYLLSLLE